MTVDFGRNDPCPCGSGKKYKYCCLESDNPEFDIIDDKIYPIKISMLLERGYDFWSEQEYPSAADKWLLAWQRLKNFILPSFADIDDLDARFASLPSLHNWCQDLESCLLFAGREGEKYLEAQIEFCDEFCEFFPDSKRLILTNMRRAAAEACFHLGQVDKGEKRFEELIDDYPDAAWAYINWGDMYTLFRRSEEVPYDPERSRELYLQARPYLEDHEQEAVEDRLQDLDQ